MGKLYNIILLSIILLLAAIGLTSLPKQARAEDRATITLSSPPTGWPPFIIRTEQNLGNDGILVEVLRDISQALGHEFRQKFYPEKRGYMLLREGLVDVIPKAKEWVADPTEYLWTDPVIDSTDVLVFRQTNPIAFSSLEDLAGLNVGLILGFIYPKLDPLIHKGIITAHRAKHAENLLRMLNHGHIDCAVVNSQVARWIISNQSDLSLDDFSFSKTTLGNAPCRFAFTKDDKWRPFIRQFNNHLAQMKKDGRLAAIIAHYQ